MEYEGRGESLMIDEEGTGTSLGAGGAGGICESLGTGKVGSCALLGAGTAAATRANRVKPAIAFGAAFRVIALCAVPLPEHTRSA